MALPENNVPWPPKEAQAAYRNYQVWDAWYAGDVEALSTLYSMTNMQTSTSIWGQIRRRFWGTPTPTTTSQRPTKLHVPLASNIARMSSQLLFSEMPTFRFQDADADEGDPDGDNTAMVEATDRLQDLLDDNAHARLLEAAEFAAAHGGSFLRVSWDKSVVPDRPFPTTVPADAALPEFRWGKLVAVTFWATVAEVDGSIYRLLERHEPGRIEWGLYRADTKEQLGYRVPLADARASTHLADVVDMESGIDTGSDLLTAVYFPNVHPNRSARKDPFQANLGRSDFDGAEDLMDQLDEVFTSWMRDIRLGKARIMVPKGFLQTGKPGDGSTFNADQEIFTEMGEQVGSLNPTARGVGVTAESFIKTFQPDIRWQEHLESATWLTDQIYAACGYSPQTFGVAGDVAITATEVAAKEKLSILSRSSKVLVVRPELARYAAALMDVDELVFDGPGRPAGMLPDVDFPDAVAESPDALAATLQLLYASESMSVEERVAKLHDDWDDEQRDTEVGRIKAEFGAQPVPSPLIPPFGTDDYPDTPADQPPPPDPYADGDSADQ